MRCISPHANYSITVFEAEEQIVVDARGFAQTHVLKKPIIANFERSGLLEHEEVAAYTYLTFSGLPEGVHPLSRVSVFDTEAYCMKFKENERAELQVQIDQRLRELQDQNRGDFIIVEPLEIPKPWATYDDLTAEEILALQQATGASPEDIYRYELTNEARPSVLEAMLRQYDPDQANAKFGVEGDDPILVEA